MPPVDRAIRVTCITMRALVSLTSLWSGRRLTTREVRRARSRCLRCGYSREGLSESACPECGLRVPVSATDLGVSASWRAAWLALLTPAMVHTSLLGMFVLIFAWIEPGYRSDAAVAMAALGGVAGVRFSVAIQWRRRIARHSDTRGWLIALVSLSLWPIELWAANWAAVHLGAMFSLN